MPHRIFIVEDHEVAREMLARYLDLQPDLEVCGQAASGEEALQRLPGDAEVVLIDMGLEGMTGREVLEEIRARWPELPCIVLSGQTAVEYASSVLRAGAAAYVEKGDLTHLLSAVRTAVAGGPSR